MSKPDICLPRFLTSLVVYKNPGTNLGTLGRHDSPSPTRRISRPECLTRKSHSKQSRRRRGNSDPSWFLLMSEVRHPSKAKAGEAIIPGASWPHASLHKHCAGSVLPRHGFTTQAMMLSGSLGQG